MVKKGQIPWNKGVRHRIPTICRECNKEFSVQYSRLKNSPTGTFFCSMNCYNKSKFGKGNPNYGKKHAGLNRGQQRSDMRGQYNPMFRNNFNPMSKGFRFDLGHVCRSAWEANYCRILKYLGVSYEYEQISFELDDNSTYTPDLKVGSNCFIEIRGYETKKGTDKLESFYRLNPQITLIIIDQKKYFNLSKTYSKKIIMWEYDKIAWRRRHQRKEIQPLILTGFSYPFFSFTI